MNVSPLSLFNIFIGKTYFKFIFAHTNINAKVKYATLGEVNKANRYTKIDFLYTDFVKTRIGSLVSGKNISVNKQLILFKGQLQNMVQISIKAVEIAFKIYSLYSNSSLYNFFLTFWVLKN